MNPRFSILHTSARPGKWREIYDAWLSNCDRPEDVEYVLVVDERWAFTRSGHPTEVTDRIRDGHVGSKPWWGASGRSQDKLLWNEGRRCYVEGVNLAAQHATGGMLIVVADDQFPCEHWDTVIEDALVDRDLVSSHVQDYILAVSTGTPAEFERGIVVMPIMSRALYENWGYVFYPEYESMFADNDLCEHAKQDSVLIEARHLMFPHKHPMLLCTGCWDIGAETAAYKAQNRPEAYELGEQLLKARRAIKFGSLNAFARAKPGQKKTVAVMLPGETFSQQWVAAWTGTLAWLSQNFNLMEPIFGYSSNPHITRMGMLDRLYAMCAERLPDYVLWIDDDNPVNPRHLKPLFEDLEEHPQIGAIAGWCWMKGRDEISAGNFAPDGSVVPLKYEDFIAGSDDIWRVDWTGFPCMLVRMEVFLKCPKPFGIIQSDIWPGFLGEDTAFCKHAAAAGFMVAVDRRAKVPHMGVRPIPMPERYRFMDVYPAIPPTGSRIEDDCTPEAKVLLGEDLY
jgi:hypothetical protein